MIRIAGVRSAERVVPKGSFEAMRDSAPRAGFPLRAPRLEVS
jgi:hypothetical protein